MKSAKSVLKNCLDSLHFNEIFLVILIRFGFIPIKKQNNEVTNKIIVILKKKTRKKFRVISRWVVVITGRRSWGCYCSCYCQWYWPDLKQVGHLAYLGASKSPVRNRHNKLAMGDFCPSQKVRNWCLASLTRKILSIFVNPFIINY